MSTAEEWSPKDRSDIGKLTKLMHIQKKIKGGREGEFEHIQRKKRNENKTKDMQQYVRSSENLVNDTVTS